GGGRNRRVERQPHVQGLGEDVHGIGGAHERAGAAAGAGRLLQLVQVVHGPVAGGDGAHRLVDLAAVDNLPAEVAGVLHTAGDDDGRDVQPGSGHQAAGGDLVAVGQQHEGVELVALGHGLDGVGDELTGGERVPHA